MSGKIVNATDADSIRIEVLGKVRAVQIPARAILAVDTVMRYCVMERDSIDVGPFDRGWEANACGAPCSALGDTPWAAIITLADEIERRRTTP